MLKSRFRDAGISSIDVLGKQRRARRIDETVVAENRVQLANSYWIDPESGKWLKACQQVIPLLPPINTIAI